MFFWIINHVRLLKLCKKKERKIKIWKKYTYFYLSSSSICISFIVIFILCFIHELPCFRISCRESSVPLSMFNLLCVWKWKHKCCTLFYMFLQIRSTGCVLNKNSRMRHNSGEKAKKLTSPRRLTSITRDIFNVSVCGVFIWVCGYKANHNLQFRNSFKWGCYYSRDFRAEFSFISVIFY